MYPLISAGSLDDVGGNNLERKLINAGNPALA